MDNIFESECGYFPERSSSQDWQMLPDINQVRNCYTDIPDGINNETIQITYFSDFNKDGYRRAGKLLYKNICPQCKKCQPIRIPISSFVPSKSQRKVLRINSDIKCSMNLDSKSFISEDKIELYRRYSLKHESKMKTREEAIEELLYWNGMENLGDTPIYCSTSNLDYYLEDTLVGCSVLDFTNDGVSSVYFYYDTSSDIMKRSLGTFSVLSEIMRLKEIEQDYYYLGYYIKGHKNMDYKANFRSYELLGDDGWKVVEQND